IAKHHIDTIITSGPPHSLHLIALKLKKKANLKWIADFRDPWTTIGYHKDLKLSHFAENQHLKLEAEVLRNADHILVTSRTTKADFEKLTERPITVITNGYDSEPATVKSLDSKFSLAHIGSLLSKRNPIFLWQVLAEIMREVPSFKNHFELK